MNQITIIITEADFCAALAIASRLNTAAGHDIGTHHSIPGVLTAAAALGLEQMHRILARPLPGHTGADNLQRSLQAVAGKAERLQDEQAESERIGAALEAA